MEILSDPSDNLRSCDWPIDRLIGVIDVRGGKAVAAIAGDRANYQPVRGGDVVAMLAWYRRMGLTQFYVADLDALMGVALMGQVPMGGVRQWAVLDTVVDTLTPDESLWWDAGWTATTPAGEFARLADACDRGKVTLILASESMQSSTSLNHFADVSAWAPDRITRTISLGLDFRSGRFLGDGEPADWVSAADSIGIRRGVILDVAAVGMRSGPTALALCGELSAGEPTWTWISGGGIRDRTDVQRYRDAGCAACLIATALMPS